MTGGQHGRSLAPGSGSGREGGTCRCEPRAALEAELERGPCRQLGDAWLLTALQMRDSSLDSGAGDAKSAPLSYAKNGAQIWEWMAAPEPPRNRDAAGTGRTRDRMG